MKRTEESSEDSPRYNPNPANLGSSDKRAPEGYYLSCEDFNGFLKGRNLKVLIYHNT